MHKQKWLMILINILGGTAVIGSYIVGFLTHANAVDVLWGGVPEGIRFIYTANMFLAAAGYFAFTYFIHFRLKPDDTRTFVGLGYRVFNILYALILIPSALWVPLTFAAVEQSSPALVWVVRLVLAIVGVASLTLLLTLLKVEPRQPKWSHRLAVLGSVVFYIQTFLLDAVVWASLFQF